MIREHVELARLLFQIGWISKKSTSPEGRGFALKLHEKNPDFPLAPIKINLRVPGGTKPSPAELNAFDLLGMYLGDFISERALRFNAIAGIPRAGEPLAKAVIKRLGSHRNLILFEKLEKEGDRRHIGKVINASEAHGTILLIDDVATGASSKLEARDSLRECSCTVSDVCVVIDREEGAKEVLLRQGIRLHALFSMGELLNLYTRRKFISPQERDEAMEYSSKVRGLFT